jgi:YD repeat-containing protein
MGDGYGRVVGISAVVEPLEDGGLALDWFGGRGRWEFDAAGRPARIERGPGTEVRMQHDDEGRLARAWPTRAASTSTSRGTAIASARRRALTAAASSTATTSWANSSRPSATGAARRYAVDEQGRIVCVSDADGVVEVVNSYDDEGRVVEQLSQFGRRTYFSYLPGQVTVTSDENDGPANTYVHDLAGRVLAIIDGDEQQTSFNYDEWGNPVAMTERSGAVTVQEWDDRSRLTLPTGASFSFATATATATASWRSPPPPGRSRACATTAQSAAPSRSSTPRAA